MEQLKKLKEYLEKDEVLLLQEDENAEAIILEVRKLISQTERVNLSELLGDKKSKEFGKNLGELQSQIEHYTSNPDIQYIQLSYYYISTCFQLFISEINNIESRYLKILTDLDKKITDSKTKYDNEIDEINKLKVKIEAIERESKRTLDKVVELLKKGKEQVSEYATKITTDNDARIDAKRKQIDVELAKYQEEIESKINTIIDTFKDKVKTWDLKFEELEGKKDDFEETLKIATTYYKEARFDEYSEAQRKQADSYRKMSLILMISVVIIILLITVYNIFAEANWWDYLTRSFLAYTLMIPAIYTSRESARHRKNADKYTQMANELRAFEATLKIDDLAPEIKNKIKEEIYKRYFGNLLFENKDMGDTFNEFFRTFNTKKK